MDFKKIMLRPKKKNSLSQLPARIAFKNPNLPHFFFLFRFLRDFQFFHLFFFPTNGKKVKKRPQSGREKKKLPKNAIKKKLGGISASA